MTNELSVEEAIELLKEKRMGINYQVNGTTQFSEALDMGIKALEQQPCENKIVEWKKDFKGFINALSMPRDDYKGIMKYIDELPVTSKPKTGHWVDIMVGDMQAQVCDQCKTFYPLAYTGGGHRFCPNCGAKMVEPQESEVNK